MHGISQISIGFGTALLVCNVRNVLMDNTNKDAFSQTKVIDERENVRGRIIRPRERSLLEIGFVRSIPMHVGGVGANAASPPPSLFFCVVYVASPFGSCTI